MPTLYVIAGWKLLENDASGPRLLAVEKRGRLAVRDRSRLEEIKLQAEFEL